MIKRRIENSKLHLLRVTLFLAIVFSVSVKGTLALQEQKAYKAAEGEIVVIFNETPEENVLLQLADKYGKSAEIIKNIGDYALFSIKDPSVFNKMIKSLSAEPEVYSAKANTSVRILSTDDPFSKTQWYIDNPGHYIDISEATKLEREATKDMDMDVTQAWESMSEGGAADHEVVVAVIDTGVDYTHPDLAKTMWINEGEIAGDEIDNDSNGYIDDIFGWDFYNDDASICHYNSEGRALAEDDDNHGTHISGIIAAEADNSIGIAGVASNIDIKIMPLKMTGGEDGTGSISNAIEAIKYATMMGADICNLSWGVELYDAGLEKIMKESDVLFVAAAGNNGKNDDKKPMYPACLDLDNMISVTCIDAFGELTDYSNYGKNSVDLAAPGDDIYSTIVGSYASMSGSSMAAPQVSAVAAMLYAYHDNLFATNVKEIITSNLKEIKGLEKYTFYGGIPSANKAVMAAGNLIPDTASPEMTLQTIFNKEEMTIPVNVKDIGPSDVRVVKWIFGEKNSADFRNGVNGTTVENNKVNLSKAGMYTFYASDFAGNETIVNYRVEEDTTAPKLAATFSVGNDYKYRTVTITSSDEQSGIRRVKYIQGVKKAEEFLPSGVGTLVTIKNGKGSFKVKEDGVYTVFATDYRGNLVTKQITIKTVKSTEFKFLLKNKTIQVGEKYVLKTSLKPVGTTDSIIYSSTNKNVAIVSATGKVTALSEGEAYIVAKTASGLSSSCLITVVPKK